VAWLHLRTLAREGRMTVTIGPRELLAALGGAVAWPVAARAQQPAMPVVGLYRSRVSRRYAVQGGLAVWTVAPATNWPLRLD